MHLSMLTPRGGEWGCRANVGHLTGIAFPNLGNLTKACPQGRGGLNFFGEEKWYLITSSRVLINAAALKKILESRNSMIHLFNFNSSDTRRFLASCKLFICSTDS